MKRPPTVEKIAKMWLAEHGYQGLLAPDYGDGDRCGCHVDDFNICGHMPHHCTAAYKHNRSTCKCDGMPWEALPNKDVDDWNMAETPCPTATPQEATP